MRVYQDGAKFYDGETGNVVFTSTVRVTDYDLSAAERARAEFFAWALVQGVKAHHIEFL